MSNQVVDVSDFEKDGSFVKNLEGLLVVKSQDQITRRKRLLNQLDRGSLGRIQSRPISEGLLVKCSLPLSSEQLNRESADWFRTFPEPRHVTQTVGNDLFMTEVGRIVQLNRNGEVIDSIEHDYFGFLHSIEAHPEQPRLLVTSSGYDSILEVDFNTGRITWDWFGWEQGFNPNQDGVFYTRDCSRAHQLKQMGIQHEFISGKSYGDQGLITSQRTTIPNVALYNIQSGDTEILSILGKDGMIVRIDPRSQSYAVIDSDFSQFPHGLYKLNGGWMVTDTLKGRVVFYDSDFDRRKILKFSNLAGKPDGLEDREWLQQVIPISDHEFIVLDANRGILFLDITDKLFCKLDVDPNWCMQDFLVLNYS